MKRFDRVFTNKSSLALLITALIIGGISAQASGLLNSPTGGYLVCVDAKTKVVTHPGADICPTGGKKLILGAQGAAGSNGLTGAAGLSGKDGRNGTDGKTLWNGVIDPVSSWGAPGDMFINSVTKTLFGPKDLTTGWPAGVIMVGATGPAGAAGAAGATGPQGPGGANGGSGPAGAQGPAGTNGTNATIAITELSLCDGPDAGTVADEKCKIGMTGPGGGTIFFVDYNDQYAGFNYLEAAPSSCEGRRYWASSGFQATSVSAAAGWAARAVGKGSANTTAIVEADTNGNASDNASKYAQSCSSGSKTDWFLGSLGEMKLMYDNLQGVGGFVEDYYWSSSENSATYAWFQYFTFGSQDKVGKSGYFYVRPMRAF